MKKVKTIEIDKRNHECVRGSFTCSGTNPMVLIVGSLSSDNIEDWVTVEVEFCPFCGNQYLNK